MKTLSVYELNLTKCFTNMSTASYTYLEIILVYNFVLNIAKISINFNSNYLSCLCIDICLKKKKKAKHNLKIIFNYVIKFVPS